MASSKWGLGFRVSGLGFRVEVMQKSVSISCQDGSSFTGVQCSVVRSGDDSQVVGKTSGIACSLQYIGVMLG